MAEENYYLILELPLDPPVKDPKRIKAQIDKKKAEWSQGINNPVKGPLFKKYIEETSKMEEAFNDEVTREKIINEALNAKKEELVEIIEAITKGGAITSDQFKKVCSDFSCFTEATIRKMIKVDIGSAPTFQAPPKPPKPPFEPMDDMQMKRFERNLNVLGKKDIYDFLGCPQTSSPNTLISKANEQLEKARKAPAKTANVNASQELAGLINTYFKKPNAKEQYDIALKSYKEKNQLQRKFEYRCTNKSISWINYQESIKECREIGMTKEEADYYVYDYYILKRKCPPPSIPEEGSNAKKYNYCKVCFAQNEESSRICTNCGTPFKLNCPKCGQDVELDKPYCSKCSFPIGDMPMALSLLKEAKLQNASGKLDVALITINKALVYWPKNVDCEKIKKEIEEKIKEEQELALKKEKEKIEQAKKLEEERKRKLAKEHIENIVLSGVVDAKVLGKTVTLSWPVATLRNSSLKTDCSKITYIVIRKKDAIPVSISDGEKLVNTPSSRYEDTSCVTGVVYGYAIIPCYNDIPGLGCIGSKKIITLSDITNIKSTVDNEQIKLSWENPPNLIGLKCIRKQGSAPKDLNDGELIPLQNDATGLVDNKLKNHNVYFYKIVALFKGTNGETVPSDGKICSATPVERPPELKKINYEIKEKDVKLSWDPIPGYTVKLFASHTSVGYSGLFCYETDPIIAKCDNISNIDQNLGKCTWKVPNTSIWFITPATCKEGMLLIGKALPVIPCVRNINVTREGGKIQVSWDWPIGVNEVRMVYRTDQQPEGPDDKRGLYKIITRSEYDNDKAYFINNVGSSSYYIAIYTLSRNNGKEVYSSPQTCVSVGESDRRTLKYTITKRKKFIFFGPTFTTLNVSVSSGGIPEMILVKKLGLQPFSSRDGAVCYRVNSSNDNNFTVDLPDGTIGRGYFIKLFFSNTEDERTFRINHPKSSDLKF